MKEMIMKNKGNLIGSSLVILLPIPIEGLLQREFVFYPLFFLAAHWLCILITLHDRKNRDQDRVDFLDASDYLSAFLQRVSFCPHRSGVLLPDNNADVLCFRPHVCCFRKLPSQNPSEQHHGHQSEVGSRK